MGRERHIDARTTLGRTLAAWRHDLIADLGGPEAVTTAQAALIEICLREKLMLDSIDRWLVSQPSLINKRRRALFPVVGQRMAIANGLAAGQRRAARLASR